MQNVTTNEQVLHTAPYLKGGRLKKRVSVYSDTLDCKMREKGLLQLIDCFEVVHTCADCLDIHRDHAVVAFR